MTKSNVLLNEIIEEKQNLKYFYVLSSIYITSILTSLIVSARLMPVHISILDYNILLTGGTWTIPLTFFILDITTEVYGYAKSKQMVFISIPIVVAYIAYLKLTTFFPTPAIENINNSYNEVFNALPRHLAALLAAIAMGNLINNYLLSKLKRYLRGKYLALRFITSTAIGEAILQIIGTTVAWFGTLHFTSQILPFVIFSYLYKISFEILMSPINIIACKWLKRTEGIDVYDN